MERFDSPTIRSHSVAWLGAHLVWCTGARRRWIDAVVLAAGSADDHVHVLVKYPPRLCVADLARHLEGASSRALHLQACLDPRATWQEGYWAESVQPTNLDALVSYIANQRRHHDSRPATAEPWEHHFPGRPAR